MNEIQNTNDVLSPPFGGTKGGCSIIIAGGGTGGHIFPAIAIANAIKRLQPNVEILFIGAKGKMEMEKIPQAGYNIKGIDIVGFNRSSLLKNISLPFKLIKSFFQVKTIINNFKPNAVIGVGGYSSFPVLRYAQSKNIPTFIHESNSFAGKSNILLGKKANKIFVASDGMEKFFPANKIIKTGNPVRANIVESKITKNEALNFFKLSADKPVILIVGGSLGAKSINDTIYGKIDELLKKNIQLIWQTGKSFSEEAQQQMKQKKDIWIGTFIDKMEYAYAAADIVVSRAGAMAVAELCIVGKPVIFVPFPFAAEDHQTLNATTLVNKNAAIMIANKDVQTKLIDEILNLINQPTLQKTLSEHISKLAITSADERIAKEVLQLIK